MKERDASSLLWVLAEVLVDIPSFSLHTTKPQYVLASNIILLILHTYISLVYSSYTAATLLQCSNRLVIVLTLAARHLPTTPQMQPSTLLRPPCSTVL